MTLLAALHSLAGTFHSAAAAAISISRAMAPPSRTYWLLSRMPRLPPVEKFFQTRLRFRFSPGVGYSQVTLFQSHSSSSATSWARPVSVPWPISERAMRITTLSSGWITTQALSLLAPRRRAPRVEGNGEAEREAAGDGSAADQEAATAERGLDRHDASSPQALARGVDRLAHLLVGAAATDVGHRRVDVGVGRLGLGGEQRGRRHDHAALAVAALGHVERHPGRLDLVQLAVLGQAFDGDDLLGADGVHRHLAGARRHAVDHARCRRRTGRCRSHTWCR